MGSEQKSDRILRLKAARQAALANNSKEVEAEKRHLRLQSLKHGPESQNLSQNHKQENTDKRKSTLDEKERLLTYTIEDTDKWNEIKRSKRKSAGSGNQSDFNEVAAMTYLKDIEGIQVPTNKKSPSLDQLSVFEQAQLAPADPALVKRLKDSYKQNNDRKLNRKRHRQTDSDEAYISRKNKDFNMKLSRDYSP